MASNHWKTKEISRCKRSWLWSLLTASICLFIAYPAASAAENERPENTPAEQKQSDKGVLNGIVKDNNGEPVAGVNIVIRSKKAGTISDENGKFSIKAQVGDQVEFSFIGFTTKTLKVKSLEPVHVRLEPDDLYLEDVVVVGYSTQRSQDVTGAIGKVTSDAIARTTNTTIESALNGRIAGVNTMASDGSLGAGVSIRIRGGTSVNASNEPLWVIDGLPIEVESSSGPSAIKGPAVSPLSNLDPGSIESIEILKDASAAAVYGSRGANGVVVVTTKAGKAGKSVITYDGSISYSTVPKSKYIELLDTPEYGRNLIERHLYEYGRYNSDVTFKGSIRDAATGEMIVYDGIGPEEMQALYDKAPNTNWQEEFYRHGLIHSHALSASGGNQGTTYSVRGNFLHHDGTMRNSYFKRFGVNFNMTNKLRKNLTLKTVLNPSYTTNKGAISGGSFSQRSMGVVSKLLSRQPDRVYGDYMVDDREDVGVWIDPISEAERTPVLQNVYGINGNLSLTYEICKGLFANVQVGGTYQNSKRKSYYSKEFGRGYQQGGLGARFNSLTSNLINQNMLMYKNNFGKHRIDAMLLFEQSWYSKDTENIETTVFDVESLGYDALQQGLTPLRPMTFLSKKAMKSYMARMSYGYGETLNMTVSFRADGSSVFVNNRWGYFPAAALSWNMHNEPWMQSVRPISKLKFRLSYGQTGNASIPFYACYSEFNSGTYILNGTPVIAFSNKNLGDPNLKWEFTDQYDFGFELGMFKNRIELTTDIYYKKTKDMLLKVPIPISTGFEERLTNIGNLENKGIEIGLKTLNINHRDFKWSTEFAFSLNRNKVLSLGGVKEQTFTDQFTNLQFTGLLREGESLGNWIGYKTNGIFTPDDFVITDDPEDPANKIYTVKPEAMDGYGNYLSDSNPKPGDLKYVDSNHDGKISSADKQIIARTQPKHMGSMYNNFSYKGFDLGIFFTYKWGMDVINGNKHRLNTTGGPNFNKTADMKDAWTPVNPDGKMPRPDYVNDHNLTDIYVEDGSFIRLQSVNFSYSLPASVMRKLKLGSLRIYANFDNLYVWTKYTGYDPEVSVATGQASITSANLDFGAYPRTLNMTFGVQLGF